MATRDRRLLEQVQRPPKPVAPQAVRWVALVLLIQAAIIGVTVELQALTGVFR